MNRTKSTACLGSGYTYIIEFNETVKLDAASIKALCTEENKAGETSKGATLTYTADVHEETDDHGNVMRTIITKETVELDTGLFTWDMDTITKLSATSRIEKDGNYNVLTLGGLGKDNGKRYAVIFKQIDPELGDLYIAMIATNVAGLSFAFARDNVTKLSPKFRALPNGEGHGLVKMFEDVPAASGTTTGT